MARIHIDTCPLCGGGQLNHFSDCKDYSVSNEDFSLFICKNCGLIFTQDFPDEKEISRYYDAPDYISHSNTSRGLVNKLYHACRMIMLCRKAALVKQVSAQKRGTLLDYGAGTGYFAHLMSRRNWVVTAVEKSSQARMFALENFKLRLLDLSAFDRLPSHSFNVITLWHVMEHVQDLDVLWRRLYDLLDDRGLLVVAVPNSHSTDAAHYGPFWAAYDVPRHLWHFSPSVISRLGAKHGFILAEQHPMPLDAFYISMLSEKYKGSWSPLLAGFVEGCICRLKTIGKKGKSSSVIYVFRK